LSFAPQIDEKSDFEICSTNSELSQNSFYCQNLNEMSGDIFDISDNILKRDKFKFELAKEHFSHFFGGQK